MDRLLDNFSLSHLRAYDALLPLVSAIHARNEPEPRVHPVTIEHTPGPVTLNSTRHGFTTRQCTSFQYSFFISQASQVKTSRNSTTQTPRERRADWLGSPT
jgi:hypothetical protein